MLNRYFIHLSYDGTAYHGWQYQPNAISVQQVLTEKISTLLREKIDLVGAGRTDTGVHASCYFAHFDSLQKELHLDEEIIFKLNHMLPPDIAAHRLYAMPENAHARFAAVSRTYHYRVRNVKDPFAQNRYWETYWPLDIGKMNAAAGCLLQHEDFSSFARTGSDNKTNLCRLDEAHWKKEGDTFIFTITANRFLRNMVRAVVGTLVDVGRGKLQVEDMNAIIEEKKRSEASMSAPACGLYLADIRYPEHYGLGLSKENMNETRV